MQFPARINKNHLIKIPKNIRDFEDFKEGEQVIVEIRRKDHVAILKNNLERNYADLDSNGSKSR